MKKMPENSDAEKTALGCALIDKEAACLVIEKLDIECFYSPRNKLIFEAIQYVNASGKTIDLMSVCSQLETMGRLEKAGGNLYIVDLASSVVAPAIIDSAIYAVKEKKALRKIIEVASYAQQAALTAQDSSEIIDKIETDLLHTLLNVRGDYKRLIEIMPAVMADIDKAFNKTASVGVSTYFPSIDRATGRFRGGELIIIAARPSDGKTALAVEICRRNGKNNIPCGFVSLEMRDIELVTRMLSMEAGVDGMKLRNGDLEQAQYQNVSKAFGKVSEYPVYIDHGGMQTMTEIKAKAKRLKMRHDIQFLVVDYLQLVDSKSKYFSQNIEFGIVTQGFKALAKELNIPIILISQLNREIEKETKFQYNKLSDLRGSGNIEQDADIVYFLIRPERFEDAKEKGIKLNGVRIDSVENIVIAHQAKHRAGKRDEKIPLKFIPQTTEFQELDIHEPEPIKEWQDQF